MLIRNDDFCLDHFIDKGVFGFIFCLGRAGFFRRKDSNIGQTMENDKMIVKSNNVNIGYKIGV